MSVSADERLGFISGRLARLRPLAESDYVDYVRQWLQDRAVTQYLFRGALPMTEADARSAFQAVSSDPRVEIELCVTAIEDGRPVGVTGLHGINWIARHAEFRILIGDRAVWGKGLGTEVCQMMVAYAFEILNMNKVWLGVTAENHRAEHSYVRSGFVKEGVLRDEIYRRGRYDDVIRMSMLRRDYKEAAQGWAAWPLIQAQLCERS